MAESKGGRDGSLDFLGSPGIDGDSLDKLARQTQPRASLKTAELLEDVPGVQVGPTTRSEELAELRRDLGVPKIESEDTALEAQKAMARLMRDDPALHTLLEVVRRTPDIWREVEPLLVRRDDLIEGTQEEGDRFRNFAPLLAGVLGSERGSQLANIAIDRSVRAESEWFKAEIRKGNNRVRELKIGSGLHATIYAAERMQLDPKHPGLAAEQEDHIGGTFAVADLPVWPINSRNRPEDIEHPHRPGTKGSLNTLMRGVVQMSDVSNQANPDQTKWRDPIKMNGRLASRFLVDCAVVDAKPVEGEPGMFAVIMEDQATGERFEVVPDRVIDFGGLGKEKSAFDMSNRQTQRIKEQEAAKLEETGRAQVVSFKQFAKWVGDSREPFALQGVKRIIVVGAEDSGRVAAMKVLGYGPESGKTVRNLDWIEELDWIGQKADTKEEFEGRERPLYKPLGMEFPREGQPDYYHRITSVNARATRLKRSGDQIVVESTDAEGNIVRAEGDLVIECTGFEDESDKIFAALAKPEVITNQNEARRRAAEILTTPGATVDFKGGEAKNQIVVKGILEDGSIQVEQVVVDSDGRVGRIDYPTTIDSLQSIYIEDSRFISAAIPGKLEREYVYADGSTESESNRVAEAAQRRGPETLTDTDEIRARAAEIASTPGAVIFPNSATVASVELIRRDNGQVGVQNIFKNGGRSAVFDRPAELIQSDIELYLKRGNLRVELPGEAELVERKEVRQLAAETLFDVDEIRRRGAEILTTEGATGKFGSGGTKSFKVLRVTADTFEIEYQYADGRTPTSATNILSNSDQLAKSLFDRDIEEVQLPSRPGVVTVVERKTLAEPEIITDRKEAERRFDEILSTPGSVIIRGFDSGDIYKTIIRSTEGENVTYAFEDVIGGEVLSGEETVGAQDLKFEVTATNFSRVEIPRSFSETRAVVPEVLTGKEAIIGRTREIFSTPGAVVFLNGDQRVQVGSVIEKDGQSFAVLQLEKVEGGTRVLQTVEYPVSGLALITTSRGVEVPADVLGLETESTEIITERSEATQRAQEIINTPGAIVRGQFNNGSTTSTLTIQKVENGRVSFNAVQEGELAGSGDRNLLVEDFISNRLDSSYFVSAELPRRADSGRFVATDPEVITDPNISKERAVEILSVVGARVTQQTDGRQVTLVSRGVDDENISYDVLFSGPGEEPRRLEYQVSDINGTVAEYFGSRFLSAEVPGKVVEQITDREEALRRFDEIISTPGAKYRRNTFDNIEYNTVISRTDAEVTLRFESLDSQGRIVTSGSGAYFLDFIKDTDFSQEYFISAELPTNLSEVPGAAGLIITRVELPGRAVETQGQVEPGRYFLGEPEVITDRNVANARKAEIDSTIGTIFRRKSSFFAEEVKIESVDSNGRVRLVGTINSDGSESTTDFTINTSPLDLISPSGDFESVELPAKIFERIDDREEASRRISEIFGTVGAKFRLETGVGFDCEVLKVDDDKVTYAFKYLAGSRSGTVGEETDKRSSLAIAYSSIIASAVLPTKLTELPTVPVVSAGQSVAQTAAKSKGLPIATKYVGLEIYQDGPAAMIPVSEREREEYPANLFTAIKANSAANFRYAERSAALAHVTARIDRELGELPNDLSAQRQDRQEVVLPLLVNNSGRKPRVLEVDLPDAKQQRLPVVGVAQDMLRFLVGERWFDLKFPDNIGELKVEVSRKGDKLQVTTNPDLSVSEPYRRVLERLTTDDLMGQVLAELTSNKTSRTQSTLITIPFVDGGPELENIKVTTPRSPKPPAVSSKK